jgi:S-adenosylmethionine uptake transporter
MLFASLDIINKKYVIKESMLSMLFYSSLVTTFLALFPIYMSEQTLRMPIAVDLVYIMILGVGSNFILFCLLKAFQLVKASSVAPFRYLELIFSILFGYIIFNELPSYNAYIGASIIIPCSFYIVFQKCTEK